MNNEELIELLKFCSPNILYVVTVRNKIIKLNTPFNLRVIQDVGKLKKGQLVICTQLKITHQGKMVFCIDDRNYYTYYFDILTN